MLAGTLSCACPPSAASISTSVVVGRDALVMLSSTGGMTCGAGGTGSGGGVAGLSAARNGALGIAGGCLFDDGDDDGGTKG